MRKYLKNCQINCKLEIIGKYSNNFTKTQFICHKCNHTTDYSMNVLGKEYIIEYNGQQHYKPTKFRQKISDEDALKKFKKQQCRDRKLRKYCKKNNIILIEIDGRKYKNQKIKTYLKKFF